jgi:hypothetical protein
MPRHKDAEDLPSDNNERYQGLFSTAAYLVVEKLNGG